MNIVGHWIIHVGPCVSTHTGIFSRGNPVAGYGEKRRLTGLRSFCPSVESQRAFDTIANRLSCHRIPFRLIVTDSQKCHASSKQSDVVKDKLTSLTRSYEY